MYVCMYVCHKAYMCVAHLPKAALAQHHDEGEVRQLDAVLVPVAVVLQHRGGGVSAAATGLPRADLRPLG